MHRNLIHFILMRIFIKILYIDLSIYIDIIFIDIINLENDII